MVRPKAIFYNPHLPLVGKRKYGEEGVTAAAEEVVGVADEVFGATEGV